MDKPLGLKGYEIDSKFRHFLPNQSFAFVFHDDGSAGLVDDDVDYEMIFLAYLLHCHSVPVVASPVVSRGKQ